MRETNEERLKRWREILQRAKPESWRWEEPKETPVPTPEEPPDIEAFEDALNRLGKDERDALILRYVDGLSPKEIAELFGFKPALALILERGAVEHLAKALDAEVTKVRKWVAWWGKMRAESIAAELRENPLASPTPECPPLDRLYMASLRWDWTDEESQHLKKCGHCKRAFEEIRERVWHPPPPELWQFVVGAELEEDKQVDIRYHLEEDRCKRCKILAEVVMKPIAEVLKTVKQPPLVAATEKPVALGTESFAGVEVKVEAKGEGGETLLRAKIERKEETWVVRAEAKGVPPDAKAQFFWVGKEEFKGELNLQNVREGWFSAEAEIEERLLREGGFLFVTLFREPTKSEVKGDG